MTPGQATPPVRPRLDYLDGIRGLAALDVVFTHYAVSNVGGVFGRINDIISLGHFSVAIFIVLSGYCLMMPVASSGTRSLRGGTPNYFVRRALRILPPYYAALVLTIGYNWIAARKNHIALSSGVIGLGKGSVTSHLLLIHDFSAAWVSEINSALWSVAVEWQIYFLLPALFLPLWRRFGAGSFIVASFALGYAPHFFLPVRTNFDWMCPWFVSLFALGMAGAVVNFDMDLRSSDRRLSRLPWEAIAWASFAAFLALNILGNAPYFLLDALCGLTAISMIVTLTEAKQASIPRSSPLLRIFESRFALTLGVFSYSLYLIHVPLLGVSHFVGKRFIATPLREQLFNWIIAVPIAVLCSYGFYLLVEKRFMTKRAAFRFIGRPAEDYPNVVRDPSGVG
jgi:peptidoglycan/LPS O-acetylase OafA/YrhL